MDGIVSAVSKWDKHASREDIDNLFYRFEGFNEIIAGEYAIVSGRKGVGKTAIVEKIMRDSRFDSFKLKIDLSEFPWDFFQIKEYAFISAWKFIVYNAILDLMSQDNSLAAEAKAVLSDRKPDGVNKRFERTIRGYRGLQVEGAIADSPLASGAKLGFTRGAPQPVSLSIAERNDIMEDFILNYISDNDYYILFDHLDSPLSDTLSTEERATYLLMLKSLLKSIFEIRDTFERQGIKSLKPISFITSDLSNIIRDRDKQKWDSQTFDLRWLPGDLARMLSYRICASGGIKWKGQNISDSILYLFRKDWVQFKQDSDEGKTIFNYMRLRSYHRPRDFVVYVQKCAADRIKRNKSIKLIPTKAVLDVEIEYSKSILGELVDEIHPFIPEIEEVLSVFPKLRHQKYFRLNDFEVALDTHFRDRELPIPSAVKVLNILYEFSVIGKSEGRKNDIGKTVSYRTFKYAFPNTTFDPDAKMSVHSSLFRALFPAAAGFYPNIADTEIDHIALE